MGNTPLHLAAHCYSLTAETDTKTHVDFVKLLLKHGADKKLTNSAGNWPGDCIPSETSKKNIAFIQTIESLKTLLSKAPKKTKSGSYIEEIEG